MQDIGFVHYWWHRDYKTAAEWFERAASVEGAPWFLRSLAASTLATGGDRQSSRLMWQAMREGSEHEWVRNDAERHLLQLDALDGLDQLQPLVDRVKAQRPEVPLSWEAMVAAGILRGIPLDPAGTPFTIEPSGKVTLATGSPIFPLPPEPGQGLPTP
jgi:hypothetical protein